MIKKIFLIIVFVIVLTRVCYADPDYYAVVIHNEPGEQAIYYNSLLSLITRADSYGIKLTLMFSATWADYIVGNATRADELAAWKVSGHEIAGHHHSIYNTATWDGYTDLSPGEALAIRQVLEKSEPYIGCLCKWFREVSKLNRKMKSACMNEENYKAELASPIIYSTCSGYANYGPVGTSLPDTSVNKAQNDYITVGIGNGIQRKWLVHYYINSDARRILAQDKYTAMTSGAHIVVTHSLPAQVAIMLDYLDFLHAVDATGAKSKTISQIIDGKLLPEESLP